MTTYTTRLTAAICAVLGAGLLGAPAAMAQDNTQSDPEHTTTLETIEVIGSHIRRVEYETVQPVLTLDREELERTGLNNVGEILQQLPQHVSDLNSDYNNGGNGETRVDLRNLGANRTLVLLNGHRYVNTLDGAVDVGSIPLPIVERIEVLTDGASAIYGSDAIAGVVNIITRDDYAGMQASASYASNERGDGERRAADITWGRTGERGNLAVNLSFADQQPIWARDRAISAVPVYGLPPNHIFVGASGATPQGVFGLGPVGFQLPSGGFGRFTFDSATSSYRRFNLAQDGYNFAPDNYLRTPYERAALFAQSRYDFTPTLALRGEALLHRRRSSQQLAPTPIRQEGFSGDPNKYSIATDNLYNSFGQPVTFFSYRPTVRARRFEQDVLTHYLSVGLEGMFDIGNRTFSWETNYIDARTRESQLITGGYDLNRLGLGVGPSFLDIGGTPRCGTPSAPIAECVPLDFLHGPTGFTQAMFDYISVDGHSTERRELQDLGINLSGSLMELPAGPLAMAAGLEHRREQGRIDLDPLLVDDAFSFGGAAPEPTDGKVRIDEAYIEFDIPLVANKPWMHALGVSLAARYSHYSTFGDTLNYKLGLSWRPTPNLLLRSTWSRGYRAPSTSELFALSGAFRNPGTPEDSDPCAQNPTGVVAERCRADGVPAGNFDPLFPPQVLFGSNPDLQPERARDRNIGLVWSPPRINGLDLSLDWWRITLDDSIDVIPPDSLPALCYREGLAGACAQLQRDPATGELLTIDSRLHNYGRYEVEGYDLGTGYNRETRWGKFRLRADVTYLSRYLKEIPKDAPPVSTVGNYFFFNPAWRVRVLVSLDWDRAPFGATLRLRHYSALDESCSIPASVGRTGLCDRLDESPVFFGEPEHVIDARTYTDLSLRWQPRASTRVSMGINNLFDRDPPVSYVALNSYDPSYDIPGRVWYFSLSQHF